MSQSTLVLVNCVQAFIACLLAAVTAANSTFVAARWARLAMSTLAGAYGIILAHAWIVDDLTGYVPTMRWLGILAWPVAWWLPCLAGLQASTRLRRAAEHLKGSA